MLSRKFTTREIVLLIILAVLLVTELYIVLVHQRVQRDLAEAQSRTETAAVSLELESAKAAKKENMLGKIQDAKKDDRRPLPDYDNSTNVVAYLNGVMSSAEEYNLVFNTVDFSNYVAMRAINMSFRCRGYSTVKSIVTLLENGPYYCEVTSLSMSAEGGIADYSMDELTLEDITGENLGDVSGQDLTNGDVAVQMTAVFYEYAGARTE